MGLLPRDFKSLVAIEPTDTQSRTAHYGNDLAEYAVSFDTACCAVLRGTIGAHTAIGEGYRLLEPVRWPSARQSGPWVFFLSLAQSSGDSARRSGGRDLPRDLQGLLGQSSTLVSHLHRGARHKPRVDRNKSARWSRASPARSSIVLSHHVFQWVDSRPA
jgi:hypothetical protein